MEGSNSSGKRIVFKKGSLAPKGDLLDSVQPQEEAPVAVEAQSAPVIDLRFEGEIFDQYYRPLSVAGGIDRLRQIARDCVGAPELPARLTQRERQECDAKHQELAEAVAHQIYHLAQKARDTDIDLYLSAFNVVLADKTPQEAKDILDRANDFFTEHYYTAIRDRGERPEMFHQIIKRVGHEASDRISRIALGLDVEKVAAELWEFYHGPHPDKCSRINDILLECTERQVRAIRDEFVVIPFKSLARQAYNVLNAHASEPKPTARKSIGKNEVHEQKRHAAYRSRDDMRALRYLFLGRSEEEMALIKRFYLDLSDAGLPESEANLEAHVLKRFSQAEIDRMGSLLDGWSAHQEAEEIHELLYPKTLKDGLEDMLSDPRDVVDRDHTQGIGPFLRRFKKRRMWRDRSGIFHRILNSWELVAERVAALSPDRFLATNQALFELRGYDLDPTMFPSLAAFDARRIATILAERIDVAGDFFEMLGPLHFMDPRRCAAVQQAFQIVCGQPLKEVVDQRLQILAPEMTAQQRALYCERYINGQGRISLDGDILGRYRGEEPEPGVWQWEYRSLPADEEAAVQIAGIMDRDAAGGELDQPIREFLVERSFDECNRLERAFYELTDPRMSLRDALRSCVSPETLRQLELILAGIDSRSIAHEIYNQPAATSMLKDLAPSQIQTVRDVFQQIHFVSLEDFLFQSFAASEDEDVLVESLSFALMPEVFQARDVLRKASRAAPDQVDLVREQCSGQLARIMGFERGFDLQFPRLRTHLKFAAARMAITPPVFAELLLCLEGVDPEVNQRILEYFDAVDFGALMSALRHYKRDQGIIEETYDLLNPEAQLRLSIKEMKIDQDLINEALLHLEGFSAKDVADELHEIVSAYTGSELATTVLAMLGSPTPQRPNHRVPEDINWMDEMLYQVTLAYHREYRVDLVDSCRAGGALEHQLEELTTRVFGMEVCGSAKELFNLLKGAKEGSAPPEHTEQRICSYLESRGLRYRARFVRAYNSFWAHYPGFNSLLGDIDTCIRDTGIRKKMHALLLGVA